MTYGAGTGMGHGLRRCLLMVHDVGREVSMLESLSLINLFVRDVPVSRQFYQELLEVPIVEADDQYTLLDIDGPHIYLHWTPPESEVAYRQRGVELYFRVGDVDQLAERLRAKGVTIREGPYDVGWRPWRCIQVEDPDGYVLFLASRTRQAPAREQGVPPGADAAA